MKKAVFIIAPSKFRDEELFEPKKVLDAAGIQTSIASTGLAPAVGVMGAVAQPDMLLGDVRADDFDVFIFVGGGGASQYWNDPLAHALIREAASLKKIIAAICIAPVTLAKAGILKGRRATVWSSETGQLVVAGVQCSGADVERDGNIITAAGPFAARAFGEAIVKALNS